MVNVQYSTAGRVIVPSRAHMTTLVKNIITSLMYTCLSPCFRLKNLIEYSWTDTAEQRSFIKRFVSSSRPDHVTSYKITAALFRINMATTKVDKTYYANFVRSQLLLR